ncbi:MAG TPA: helix-turn-helix transcriptional regulator [Ktedonobacteraceae bacterium]
MAGKRRVQRQPSALSQILIIYRDSHKLTQEELAKLLDVEPRTLRRWETGETVLTDTHDLKQIADRLGIPYENLGIASSSYIPLPLNISSLLLPEFGALLMKDVSVKHMLSLRISREKHIGN